MLTGRRAFSRETTADTMTAILKEDLPDIPSTQRSLPATLERIVDRCVEKSPASRFQSAKDLGFALESLSSPSGAVAAVNVGRTVARREKLAWAAAAALALIATAAIVYAFMRGSPSRPTAIEYFMTLPRGAQFTDVPIAPFPAIAPNGLQLAFVAQRDGAQEQELWVLDLDSTDPHPVDNTSGARLPFWSADSQWIGFEQQGMLMKVDIRGGPPLPICSVVETGFEGASWNRDGTILFGSTRGGLFQVPQAGGNPRPATMLDSSRGETSHRQPHFLPDGRQFLYLAQSPNTIHLGSLDGAPPKKLLTADSKAMYSSYSRPGHVLFVRSGTLLARPFDASRGEFTGDEFPVVEEVRAVVGNGRATFSVSDTGVLVYREGGAGSTLRVSWVDPMGKAIKTVGEGDIRGLSLAIDGRMAWHTHEEPGGGKIWAHDETRRTTYPLTFRAHTTAPIWSPDGSFIAYSMLSSTTEINPPGTIVAAGAGDGLYRVRTDGSTEPELLVKGSAIPTDWTGDSIVFERQDPKTGWDLWRLPLTADPKPVPLHFNTRSNERRGRISPSERWIAYESNEDRRSEVYVRSVGTPGGVQRISANGGAWPMWSRDGTRLYYLRGRELVSVPVKSGESTFRWDAPSTLFQVPIPQNAAGQNYAVSLDAQRFLVVTAVDDQPSAPLTILHNWLVAAWK
jgi:Tol biopolymer transport system component